MKTYFIYFSNGTSLEIKAIEYLVKEDGYIFTGNGGAVVATVLKQHVFYIAEKENLQ